MSGDQVRSYPAVDLDPAELLAAKAGRRVSVVIPARDEQQTVAEVVAAVRADWVESVPLVDELLVIDSDSRDRTAALAAGAGATVISAATIRPDLGPAQGKGEALWKAQHVVTGDLLVFLDADLTEWGSHFVPRLLWPLLTDPTVALVKSSYDRPLQPDAGLGPVSGNGSRHPVGSAGAAGPAGVGVVSGGGRVTELVARPLLALHWPQLRDVVQPLSGEWAIRAEVLRQLPIPVGYGVEIAVLLDVAARFGLPAIAQVDLGRRGHRHQPEAALGVMAVQVLAAVERRLPNRLTTEPDGDLTRLRQFARSDGGFVAVDHEVPVWERPPFADVAPAMVARPTDPAVSFCGGSRP